MKRILVIAVALLATGCQMKGGDPVVTTTGKVPVPVADRSVTLSWNASTGTVQGYKVEASLDGTKFVELGTTSGSAVSISGLPTGATYYFRVRAYNQGGNSGYTNVGQVAL
jgi:hypothetical protein